MNYRDIEHLNTTNEHAWKSAHWLASLESSTNHILLYIQAMLEDMQHDLDGIGAGAMRLNRATHRREQQQKIPKHRYVHEDYTDNEE